MAGQRACCLRRVHTHVSVCEHGLVVGCMLGPLLAHISQAASHQPPPSTPGLAAVQFTENSKMHVWVGSASGPGRKARGMVVRMRMYVMHVRAQSCK